MVWGHEVHGVCTHVSKREGGWCDGDKGVQGKLKFSSGDGCMYLLDVQHERDKGRWIDVPPRRAT